MEATAPAPQEAYRASSLRAADKPISMFSSTETAELLPYERLVPALRTAATELLQGQLRAPERMSISYGQGNTLLCMPAVGHDISITKVLTVHDENATLGRPAIQGELIVIETWTGRRLMLLDGPTVTARRTAALSLLGIQLLGRPEARSAIILGTGVQAEAHIEALITVLNFDAITVVGRSANRAAEFVRPLQHRFPSVMFTVLDYYNLKADTFREVDVAVTLTTSREPVLPDCVPDRVLIVGVGAFRPDMAEIPPEVVRSRTIFVDYEQGARHEAGDLLQAHIDWKAVRQLGDLLSGPTPTPADGILLKTVGHSAWDLAAARVAIATHAGQEPDPD